MAAFLKMTLSACDGLMADKALISDLKVPLLQGIDLTTTFDLNALTKRSWLISVLTACRSGRQIYCRGNH